MKSLNRIVILCIIILNISFITGCNFKNDSDISTNKECTQGIYKLKIEKDEFKLSNDLKITLTIQGEGEFSFYFTPVLEKYHNGRWEKTPFKPDSFDNELATTIPDPETGISSVNCILFFDKVEDGVKKGTYRVSLPIENETLSVVFRIV